MLLEALVCGDTEIASNVLEEQIEQLQQINSETDETGFSAQFKVNDNNFSISYSFPNYAILVIDSSELCSNRRHVYYCTEQP